jgi:alkaline phosphatase
VIKTLPYFLALLFVVSTGFAGTIDVDVSFYEAPTELELPLHVNGEVMNVILFIGDGMGNAHFSAAQYAAVGPEGRLHMQTMPVTGLMGTYAKNRLITDSAASGSAMATGYKTDNGMISQLPDGSEPETILEASKAEGKATGLVATSTITHATPASFAAHHFSRSEEKEIALDMAVAGVDVLFGAGWKHWLPEPDGGRTDGRDLFAEMNANGYVIARTGEEILAASDTPVIGLLRDGALYENDEEPSLAELTAKAIDLLSADDDGFFLMVEGSQIDWEGHSNEEDEIVRRTLLFDMAIGEALNFAKADGNTLVIVTADHETGGMALTKGRLDGSGIVAQFTTTNHTAGPVAVFAYGPGAIRYTGMYENSDLAIKIAESLGLEDFLKDRAD